MSDYLSAQASRASIMMVSRFAQATDQVSNDAERLALEWLTKRYPTSSWHFDMNTLLSWPAAGNVKHTVCTPISTASQTSNPKIRSTLMTTTRPPSETSQSIEFGPPHTRINWKHSSWLGTPWTITESCFYRFGGRRVTTCWGYHIDGRCKCSVTGPEG